MIDLRSDTVTKPTPGMREAMAQAEVGDDVYGEDPTVNALEAKAARLLGKDAALFVPTGVMANQLCLRLHTRPGDEVLVEGTAHIIRYEGGSASALSQIQLCCVEGNRGLLTADRVLSAIRPKDIHNPPTTLLCLEQTHNFGGGSVYPLSTIREITKLAGDQGLALHLDGARLFNAAVASGVSAAECAQPFDTVSFCLSKGLGAPVGSLITSTQDRIAKLRRLRKMFGGRHAASGYSRCRGHLCLGAPRHPASRRPRQCQKFRTATATDSDGVRGPRPRRDEYCRVRGRAKRPFDARTSASVQGSRGLVECHRRSSVSSGDTFGRVEYGR